MLSQSIRNPLTREVVWFRYGCGTIQILCLIALIGLPLHGSTELFADEPAAEPAAEQPADSEGAPDQAVTEQPAEEDPVPAEVDAEVLELGPVTSVTNVTFPDRENGTQPDWLEKEPWQEDGRRLVPVMTRVQTTKLKAMQVLDDSIREEAEDYVAGLLESRRAAELTAFEISELKARCLAEEPFVERVVVGDYGETYRAHALLKFDEAFAGDATSRWRQVTATRRLTQTGLGAAMVLLVLSTLFGYFKLDTATRGYYTARLQFATVGTILALAVAGAVFYKWWGSWL